PRLHDDHVAPVVADGDGRRPGRLPLEPGARLEAAVAVGPPVVHDNRSIARTIQGDRRDAVAVEVAQQHLIAGTSDDEALLEVAVRGPDLEHHLVEDRVEAEGHRALAPLAGDVADPDLRATPRERGRVEDGAVVTAPGDRRVGDRTEPGHHD